MKSSDVPRKKILAQMKFFGAVRVSFICFGVIRRKSSVKTYLLKENKESHWQVSATKLLG